MGSAVLLSWALLGVTLISIAENLQMDDNSHQVIRGSFPMALSRHRRDKGSPSTFQVGNITVQTGETWSVKFSDFMTVRRKPGGGVDVEMQPSTFLSRMFPRNGSLGSPGGADPSVSQNFKNSRPKLSPAT